MWDNILYIDYIYSRMSPWLAFLPKINCITLELMVKCVSSFVWPLWPGCSVSDSF